jgi:transketolase
MVGLAAGMAKKGFKVFVYSIAPFIVFRALEQIRNDVCFHNLNVTFIGNGGGYGYGIMGATHHALNDVAIMSSLDNMEVYVPAFNSDIKLHLNEILKNKKPAYLRLGYGNDFEIDSFQDIAKVNSCSSPAISIAVMGPIINNLLNHQIFNDIKSKVDIFSFQKYPIQKLNNKFIDSLKKTKKLMVLEEHAEVGGLAQQLISEINKNNIYLNKYINYPAVYYPNGKYGDQNFHQSQSHLDGNSIIKNIKSIL